MADVNNFGLKGVGRELQLGKSGNKVISALDGTSLELAVNGASQVTVTNDSVTVDSTALFRIENDTDLSLISTLHPFQIGLTGGGNLAMDSNEIQARNNSAASALNINLEGGTIELGKSGSGVVSANTKLVVDENITINNGSVSNPSLAFTADPNTGIYHIGENVLGVSAGGSTIARFDNSAGGSQLLLQDGSASVPTLSFASDTNSGIYSSGANQVGVAVGGSTKFIVTLGYTSTVGNIRAGTGADEAKTITAINDHGGIQLRQSTDGKSYIDQTDDAFAYEKTWLELERDGAVSIRHNGTTVFKTTATGIDITGDITSGGDPLADTYVATSREGAANGVATLGADSKIPQGQLPAIAITDTFVVASEVAMLALTAQTGDVAIRTDINSTYILAGSDSSTLGDWQLMPNPAGTVVSVNGQTNIVTLVASDVGALAVAAKAADSDKLDGIDSASFIRSDATDTVTAATTWLDNANVQVGTSQDTKLYHNGTHSYLDTAGAANMFIRQQGTADIRLQTAGGVALRNVIIAGGTNGQAELYYDGTKIFETLDGGTKTTGHHTSTGYIQAGLGSGGVGLTHNDGYGNANIVFNHMYGKSEQNGNAGRIRVNTDATSGAYIKFEVGNNLATGVATALTEVLDLNLSTSLLTGTLNASTGLQEGGVALSAKYLGITAKAADSDLLDGYNPAVDATGDTIVLRASNGDIAGRYLYCQYIGLSGGIQNRTSDTIFYSSTDQFIYKNTATSYRTSLDVYSKSESDAGVLGKAWDDTWFLSNTASHGSGVRAVLKLDVGTVGSYSGVQIDGKITQHNTNWGENLLANSFFRLTINFTSDTVTLQQDTETTKWVLQVWKESATVFHLLVYSNTPNQAGTIQWRQALGTATTVTQYAPVGNIRDTTGWTLAKSAPDYVGPWDAPLADYLPLTGGTITNNLTVSGQILQNDGSAGVPPYSFASDPNSGLFSSGQNLLGFATAGTEQMRIDNYGAVLHKGRDAARPSVSFINDNFSGMYSPSSNVIGFSTNGTERVLITNSGISEGGTQLSAKYLGITAKAADSDLLDGYNLSTASTADTVARRDAGGDLAARYFKGQYVYSSHSQGTRSADTIFYSSTDEYHRKNTAGGFRTSLDVYSKSEVNAKGGVANGFASLDGSGLVPTNQLPALAITQTYTVANEAAMLALTAQRGDVAVRTDISTSFILTTDVPTVLGNWTELLSPADGVASITAGNGLTGGTITSSGTIAVSYSGTGASTNVARGDHNHNATYLGLTATADDSTLLNGYSSTDSASTNTIVRRSSSGYIYCNYINLNGSIATLSPTSVIVETASDGFIRRQTPANFISNLDLMKSTDTIADSDALGGIDAEEYWKYNPADSRAIGTSNAGTAQWIKICSFSLTTGYSHRHHKWIMADRYGLTNVSIEAATGSTGTNMGEMIVRIGGSKGNHRAASDFTMLRDISSGTQTDIELWVSSVTWNSTIRLMDVAGWQPNGTINPITYYTNVYSATKPVAVTTNYDGGGSLYENNTPLSSLYLGKTAKATDSNKLDNLDSTQFLRSDDPNANASVDLNNVAGAGLRFWDGSVTYSIYMSDTANGTWGGETSTAGTSDYNMYFKMASGTNRGFVFMNDTTANAQIDGSGNLFLEGNTYLKSNKYLFLGDNDQFGLQYNTNGNAYIKNSSHGGRIYLLGEDGTGTQRDMITADPDDSVWLYYAGGARLQTTSAGGTLTGTWNATTGLQEAGTNLSAKYLGLTAKADDSELLDGVNGASYLRSDAADTVSGILTHTANAVFQDNKNLYFGTGQDFYIRYTGTATELNSVAHGASIYIQGEDAGGVNRTIFAGDPDGSSTLYHAGTPRLSTTTAGADLTGNFRTADGAAGTPSHTFTSDGDTGMYRISSDVLGFSTAGAERMRLSTAGLTMAGAGKIIMNNGNIEGVNELSINDPGEGIAFIGTNTVRLFAVDDANDNIMNFQGAARVQVNGVNVLTTSYGKATDANLLDGVNGASYARSDATDTISGYHTHSNHLLLQDGKEMRFGNSSDCHFFHDGSDMYTDMATGNWYIRDSSTTRFTFDDAGHFTATGNVTAYSDERIKENFEVIPNALDKVSQLTGYTFDRTDCDIPRQAGLKAQDVEKVLPEVVQTDPEDEDGIKSVAYGNMVGLLVEAIKELKDENKQLRTELEDKVSSLETLVQSLINK